MSDNEVEDVSFLPAPTKGGSKKAVYEPKGGERIKQLVCTPKTAALIVILFINVILIIALIAAFARPSCPSLNNNGTSPSERVAQNQPIATDGSPFPWTEIRLPGHIIPLTYSIHMHPNLTTYSFKGTVNITLKVAESKSFIIFHAKNLALGPCMLFKIDTISDEGFVALPITRQLEYPAHNQVYLGLKQYLDKGANYRLQLEFSGNLTDTMAGFYRSSYKDDLGNKRWIATTQFEPVDARAAFPCFDEPSLKANFSLHMVRDSNFVVLFNTPRISSNDYGKQGLVIDHFETSVQMSTYLVAFIVCDYEKRTKVSKGKIKVSVYAPPPQINLVSYSLDVATKALDYFEVFYNIKYPLSKQDLIAIPDYSAGAMENWGLITFLSRYLLIDQITASPGDKQAVAVVITHELAHQWFGNLVTMKWWNDLWLNEAFASFMEYKATNNLFPEMKMMDQFVTDASMVALYRDSLRSSHPISVEVHDPAEIEHIFDAISYEKGASIIRMLEGFLSESVFKTGLTQYLRSHALSNAETNNLWDALSVAAKATKVDLVGHTVKEIMDTWTLQMGYPVVIVTNNGDYWSLQQERYLVNPRSKIVEDYQSPFGYKWHIPVTYVTASHPQPTNNLWMNMGSGMIKTDSQESWIKCNVDLKGFYRVHYDAHTWHELTLQLQQDQEVFSPSDRANLIADAFALSRSGHLDVKAALNLSRYLTQEDNYIAWQAATAAVGYIGHLLEDSPHYTAFKEYMLSLLERQLQTMTWDKQKTHMKEYLQSLVLGKAVFFDHEASKEHAQQLFNTWKANTSFPINPNLKYLVYGAGVKYGSQVEWDFMLEQFHTTHTPAERKKFLMALADTRDVSQLSRYLELSLDTSIVRSQETISIIRAVAVTGAGQILAWRFVQTHWEELFARYRGLGFQLKHLVLSPTQHFHTQFDYEEVKNFLTPRLPEVQHVILKQALEKIELNIDWVTRNKQPVIDWLNNELRDRTHTRHLL